MRSLQLLAVPLMLLGACAPAQEAPDWGPRIRAANEALLNQGDVDRVPEFFAASYVAHDAGGEIRGREGIEDFITALREAFPDLEVEIEVLVSEADRVAWLRTSQGTHQGDIMGVPASGRLLTWQDIIVTRYEDNIIAEEWGVSGLAEALDGP